MAEYKKYYVAFLDILGFKNLIIKNDCEYIRNIFDNFKKSNVLIKDDDNKTIKFNNNDVHLKIMSDSIIFYVDASIPNACLGLLCHCAAFQADLLTCSTPELIRGGISYGDFYIEEEKDIIFGPALTQAYLLEEKSAKYPRIIVNKSTLDISEQDYKHIVFRDDDAFYSVNFYAMLKLLEQANKSIITRIYTEIEKHLDSTVDSSIREKYLYMEKKMKQFGLGENYI